jgi:hypothetical protein
MSFEVATPGCGAKSGSWLGSASGMNEVRASAGAPAATTPAPIQSSFKNARLSIEVSRNFAEILAKLEPGAKVPSELLGLAARHRRKLESRAGKWIGPKNYLRTSRPKPIITSPPDGAFDLCVPEQKLHGAQIASTPGDQSCLRPT